MKLKTSHSGFPLRTLIIPNRPFHYYEIVETRMSYNWILFDGVREEDTGRLKVKTTGMDEKRFLFQEFVRKGFNIPNITYTSRSDRKFDRYSLNDQFITYEQYSFEFEFNKEKDEKKLFDLMKYLSREYNFKTRYIQGHNHLIK